VTFHAGQTFLYPLNDDNESEHLWIITTEQNNEGLFAIASLTSLRGAKDQTVILHRGEHPFITHDTCISYAQAEITSADKLEVLLQCGRAKLHVDAIPTLLKDILDGFSGSPHTRNRIRDFVREARAK
jgi:hypothetical protein